MSEEKKENTAKIDKEKQERLKAKTEVADKDDQVKTESPEVLRTKLSNKNSDYVFRLQKELEKQGKLSSEEAAAKVNELLPEIVVAQRHGQPANGLYMASPVIKAGQILHPEVKPKTIYDIPFWQRAVDNVLLWVALFMGMYGLLGLFNTKNTSGQNGILSTLVMSIFFGLFMAKYYEWIMPRDKQGKSVKISWMKIVGLFVLLFVAMVIILAISNLPFLKLINPVLPGVVYLIIAAVAFGGRYLFRKKYDITTAAFGPTSTRR